MLKSPVDRALHLLALHGLSLEDSGGDSDVLAESFAVREEIDDLQRTRDRQGAADYLQTLQSNMQVWRGVGQGGVWGRWGGAGCGAVEVSLALGRWMMLTDHICTM